jgi:DNA-directed RNA polymerase specialized sigma24 family protein
MAKISSGIDDVHLTAFTEKVGAESDNLYRFSYSVLLDMKEAYEVVKMVIQHAAKQLDAIQDQSESEVKNLIFKECWHILKAKKANASNKTLTDQLGKLSSLKQEERATIILSDFIGFKPKEAADILGVDEQKCIGDLVVARKALIG